MIFVKQKVWAVRWGDEHFAAHPKKPLANDVSHMGSGVVGKEGDKGEVWVLAWSLTGQRIKLLAVQLWSKADIVCQQFKQHKALVMSPVWKHDLFRIGPSLGCLF